MGGPGPIPISEPRLAYEDLWARFMNTLAGLDALEAECAALQGEIKAIVRHVEALMNAMACERPLREPETSAEVLAAWDALVPWIEARSDASP
jgi:hypothetical protein